MKAARDALALLFVDDTGVIHRGHQCFVTIVRDTRDANGYAAKRTGVMLFAPSRGWFYPFEYERRMLESLDHPGIVKVYDYHLEVEFPKTMPAKFSVMTEQYAGHPLREYFKDGKLFPESSASTIGFQLLQIVEYLHDRRVVHNDINIDHVMMCDRVRLIDFSRAWRFADGEKMELKRHGPFQFHFAPEMVREDGCAYDARAADIWACGTVILAAHTRLHLFPGGFASERYRQWCANPRERFDALGRIAMSEELKDLITRMLDPIPEKRPTAREALAHPFFRRAAAIPVDKGANERV